MEKYLKRRDVAELLQMPVRTIDYLVSTRQIPFSRVGQRSVRFNRKRIETWFQEREGVEFHLKRDKNGNKSHILSKKRQENKDFDTNFSNSSKVP